LHPPCSGNFGTETSANCPAKNQATIIGLSLSIDKSGLIKEKYSRVPILDLILFVIRSLAAFRGTAEFDPKACEHWAQVEKVKQLRDRIAHPKTIEEMELSGDDLGDCEKAVIWLWDAIQKANGSNTRIKIEKWTDSDFRSRTVKFGQEGTVPAELSPPSV
jgi:hypothetical protein